MTKLKTWFVEIRKNSILIEKRFIQDSNLVRLMNASKTKNKDFRLRTKKFFLTYPKLPKEFDLISLSLENFERIFKMPRTEFKYVASVESHEDGTPHLHVYLEFTSPQGIYSESKLDLEIGGKMYHGNYQSVKVQHGTVQYIIKSVEGPENVSTNMELPIYKGVYFTNVNEHLYEVLKEEGNSAAIDLLYSQYPKQAIQRGSTILKNLELAYQYNSTKKSASKKPKYSFEDFKELPKDIVVWLESDPAPTLLLFGPSGTGKTELAKALMDKRNIRTIFVRNKEGLKDFRRNFHQGIIFDDLDVSELSREELIHLLDIDNESQIRVLYGFVVLPSNLIKIFTTNTPQYFLRNDNALKRRIKTIPITKPVQISSTTPSLGAGSDRVIATEPIKSDNNILDLDSIFENSNLENTLVASSDRVIAAETSSNEKMQEAEVVPVKRKRGRPKGSKNKTKKSTNKTKK